MTQRRVPPKRVWHAETIAAAAWVLDLGISTLWRAIEALGLTAQNKELRAAEQGRLDVAESPARGGARRRRPWTSSGWSSRNETWAGTKMTCARGRRASGKRLMMPVPHGNRKTTTSVAALRAGGLPPPIVDGAINGERFEADIRQQLAPTPRPGDLLVTNNLSSHKWAGVRRSIEAASARLVYKPAYSPD